jgi:hypothetical protein
MLNRGLLDEVYRIRDGITYRELMVDPTYMDTFLSACFLPHTDISRFPSVARQSQHLPARPGKRDDPVRVKTRGQP